MGGARVRELWARSSGEGGPPGVGCSRRSAGRGEVSMKVRRGVTMQVGAEARELIRSCDVLDTGLDRRVNLGKVVRGDRIAVQLTIAELKDLLGWIAFKALPCEEPARRRQLNRLYDRLVRIEKKDLAKRGEGGGPKAGGTGGGGAGEARAGAARPLGSGPKLPVVPAG